MKQFLATGVIRSPHGLKGFVKVHSYSDDYSHFHNLKDVVLEKAGKQRAEEIEKILDQGSIFLVKFKGIDSPEQARFLSGWDILVPREKASKLGKDEVYAADLVGVKLMYNDEEVGQVVSFLDGPQALLLEVKCNNGKIRLVPYLKGIFVDNVNISEGTMTLLNRGLVE